MLERIDRRDYSISGPTLIRIFDDRLKIATIGGLVRGISYDDTQPPIGDTKLSLTLCLVTELAQAMQDS